MIIRGCWWDSDVIDVDDDFDVVVDVGKCMRFMRVAWHNIVYDDGLYGKTVSDGL